MSRRRFDVDGAILPLINVAFLLLVFFVAAGTIAPQREIEPPRAEGAAIATTAAPRITIAADGSIAIDGTAAASLDALATAGDGPLREALVLADRRAPATALISTIDRLRALGVASVALETENRGR